MTEVHCLLKACKNNKNETCTKERITLDCERTTVQSVDIDNEEEP